MIRKLIAIVVVLFVLIGSSIAFDKSPGQFKEFDGLTRGEELYVNVEGNWIDITIIGHAEGLYPDIDENQRLFYRRGTGLLAQNGSGYHLGNGWIVTAAHVVIPRHVVIQEAQYFFWGVSIDKVIDIDYTIGNSLIGYAHGRLIWVDEEQDLALLWTDPKTTPILRDSNYSTEWTFSSEIGSLLLPGDAIATIVKVRHADGSKSWYYEVRYGKIVSQKVVLPKGLPSDILPWFSMYDFTMELLIYPGDSGSPVFAFSDGKPVIIGIARAVAWSVDEVTGEVSLYSYATRIDAVHQKLLER